jgi:hypothetical protein
MTRKSGGLCVGCNAVPSNLGRAMCEPCRVKNVENSRKSRARLKELVFSHYGGKCSCCGNDNIRVLQLDHKYNNGAEHRKALNNGSNSMGGCRVYRWAKLNEFPSFFQILCANCHHIKTVYGECELSDHIGGPQ